jgi:transcriptional regulator with XRE-family HTH domain
VAQLAEIGVDWYTKLEQGRPAGVSAKTLTAVATALQCSPDEIRYLFDLAGLKQRSSEYYPICERLSSATQMMLDQLDPLPALIQNTQFDVIGFNQAYSRLMGVDLTSIPEEERNCIHLALTNPNWKAALLDYDDLLLRLVSMFRAAMANHLEDRAWQEKLQRYLDVSPDFRRIWERHQVQEVENHVKRFNHPILGELRLRQTNWWSAPTNGLRLLVYVPVDEPTRSALHMNSAG